MGIELTGTRAEGIAATGDLADRIDPAAGASVAIASAYWDTKACVTALDLARRAGSPTQLVLWTAGATRKAWLAVRDASGDPGLELRFIDSPAEGGIFVTVQVPGDLPVPGSVLRLG